MFDGSARLARELRHVDALDVDGYVEPGGQVAAELRVCIRLGAAKLMVQMCRAGNLKAFGLCDLAEREQQRDRICSARQRDNDTAAGRKQSVTADGAADGVDHAKGLGLRA